MGLFGPPNVNKLKAKGNVKGLIKALRYREDMVRAAAACALGQIGDARAVEPLIAALKDRDLDVRRAAAGTLGQIGDAQAVAPLIAALKDMDSDVRQAAVEALDSLAWQPDKSEAGAVYWIAKRKWGKCVKIGAPAVEPLIVALKDRDWDARKAATRALDNLGWQPDKSEAGAAYWVAKHKWDKCVEIGVPAVGPLIDTLQDESWRMRRAVAEALVKMYRRGRLRDKYAVRSLVLQRRPTITEEHVDRSPSSNSTAHEDTGIGVSFPI